MAKAEVLPAASVARTATVWVPTSALRHSREGGNLACGTGFSSRFSRPDPSSRLRAQFVTIHMVLAGCLWDNAKEIEPPRGPSEGAKEGKKRKFKKGFSPWHACEKPVKAIEKHPSESVSSTQQSLSSLAFLAPLAVHVSLSVVWVRI